MARARSDTNIKLPFNIPMSIGTWLGYESDISSAIWLTFSLIAFSEISCCFVPGLGRFSRGKSFGNILIPPKHGELASGLVGEGRLPDPQEIVQFIEEFYSNKLPLIGKKVLITAGATIEELDPVVKHHDPRLALDGG